MKLIRFALLCAIGLTSPILYAQMTTITASSLKIGQTAIPTGTVCAVAVDATEQPISVAISGGGIQGVGASCADIVNGAITTDLDGGTYQVADEALAGNPGFNYTFTITDTSKGNPTSGKSFQLHMVPGVAGSTFALDHYVPTTSINTYNAFTFTTGVGAPVAGCVSKAFYQDNTSSTAPVLYNCGTDKHFHVIAGGGSGASAATASTLGTVQLAVGQTSTTLSKVATTGAYADVSGTPTLGTAAGHDIAYFDLSGAAAAAQAAAIAASVPIGQKGTASGVATLNSSSVVPPAQLGIGTLDASHWLDGTGHFTIPPGATYSAFVGSGTGHAAGLVPDPGATAGTTRYLREDGTFATPPGSSYTTFVGSGASHATGLVPDPGSTAGTSRVLHEDGTWGAPYNDTTHNTYMQFSQAAGGSDVLPTFVTGVPTLYLSGGKLLLQYGTSGGSPLARISDVVSPYVAQTDGATVAWNAATPNGTLTLVHTTSTRTLNVTGLVNGEFATLILKQDSTGVAGTFNLGTGCAAWYLGGSSGFTVATTLTLTSTANAVNIMTLTYDGTNCYINLR